MAAGNIYYMVSGEADQWLYFRKALAQAKRKAARTGSAVSVYRLKFSPLQGYDDSLAEWDVSPAGAVKKENPRGRRKHKMTVRTTLKRAAKAATSLIPSKYIPAQIRRDPKTGKIKVKVQPSRLKRSTRTGK